MKDVLLAAHDRRQFLRGALGLGGGVAALAAGCAESKPAAPAPANPTPAPANPTPAPAAGPALAPVLAAAPATPPPPALPDGLDPAHFHLHNPRPLALEARRSALGRSVITPTSRFFVRNNLPMPDASILDDRLGWAVELKGVAKPGRITVAELQQLPAETIAAVVQCSGNGRKFFAHGPSGSKWATGAAGCAMWTGVRLADVVQRFGGAVEGMAFLTSTGGEPIPEGVEPESVRVERSIPLEKAMRDAMLVWEMNGAPIPLTHGGPLRLLVPGYYGCNQIKYVRELAFTAEQTRCKIQHSGYRLRPIGEKGGPAQPSMWRMNVKSWVFGPGADDEPVLAGAVQFYGAALSGERGVRGVEVSLDEGKTWQPARWTGPDLGPAAWRTFAFEATLPPGEHRIYSRATDTEGDVQPEARTENERGYGHNGWRDHGLTVKVVQTLPKPAREQAAGAGQGAAAAPAVALDSATLSDEGRAGKALVQKTVQPACGACHTLGDAGLAGTVGPNLDAMRPDVAQVVSAVSNGVGAMPSFKGMLSEAQIRQIATYVVEATRAR